VFWPITVFICSK